jgi:catechol 2,3-dioxygenase
VLATGRPDKLPANTANPQFGPSINQISFRMGSLDDLRDIKVRLETHGASSLAPTNHGVAWSLYAHDPEGNNLEFFVDTPWYILQPLLAPLDLAKGNDAIVAETRSMCEQSEGFETYASWRARIAPRMTAFRPPHGEPGEARA